MHVGRDLQPFVLSCDSNLCSCSKDFKASTKISAYFLLRTMEQNGRREQFGPRAMYNTYVPEEKFESRVKTAGI